MGLAMPLAARLSSLAEQEQTMRISGTTRRLLLGSLAVLLTAAVAFRPAPVAIAVSGEFTLTYVNPSVAKGTNARGASIFISTARGTNRNTGAGKYLSTARVVNVDTAAMLEGDGTHSGNATFAEGSNTLVKSFAGTTSTTMVKGRPESTFRGRWRILRGTGRYAGVTGNGTYTGRFETETIYTVAWAGNVSM